MSRPRGSLLRLAFSLTHTQTACGNPPLRSQHRQEGEERYLHSSALCPAQPRQLSVAPAACYAVSKDAAG